MGGSNTEVNKNFNIGVGKFHFQEIFIEALALQKNHVPWRIVILIF